VELTGSGTKTAVEVEVAVALGHSHFEADLLPPDRTIELPDPRMCSSACPLAMLNA
jgi:hypothetical protein